MQYFWTRYENKGFSDKAINLIILITNDFRVEDGSPFTVWSTKSVYANLSSKKGPFPPDYVVPFKTFMERLEIKQN